MSSGDNGNHSSERQPLHKEIHDDTDFSNDLNVHNGAMSVDVTSLIDQNTPSSSVPDDMRSFSIEPVFQNTLDNPYRETTVSVPHMVRRVPSSEMLPRPWKHLQWILIASYISLFLCIPSGALAYHYATKAMKHHSKGLYGLMQRDSRFAVWLIYASFVMGILLIIIITVVLVCKNGC
ncbi:unnamed protein product [Acanthosepion pharaonis]|uniref:Uncharacterized protein n=1 Tax=Acanthosepion pharaonis TaxID=158019 RepID=A0A812BZ97_ACAPH|nr:unnamed protein product [Sepia pharaonis]